MEDKIYAHDEAMLIVEMFENILSAYDISVPSHEDDEREPEEEDMMHMFENYFMRESEKGVNDVGVDIHIPADEVWSFFQKNKDRCNEEMIAIAENTGTEYAVYLTEENGYPSFSVCKGDGEPEYEEGAISENDCTDTAKRCYLKYLFPVIVRDDKTTILEEEDNEDDFGTMQNMEDAIYEREDELRLALCDFIQVVLRESGDGVDIMDIYGVDMVDDILGFILEYMATELCLDIYRPTIVVDEYTGCKLYTEYPYDSDVQYEEFHF